VNSFVRQKSRISRQLDTKRVDWHYCPRNLRSTLEIRVDERNGLWLLASTEKSAITVVLDDPGPCGCRSIPGGLKLKSQIERLHPKSEPVPRCCRSDWYGKIQIHENQESATNSRSMHPMKGPQVIQHASTLDLNQIKFLPVVLRECTWASFANYSITQRPVALSGPHQRASNAIANGETEGAEFSSCGGKDLLD
jgi:hypothetical protein